MMNYTGGLVFFLSVSSLRICEDACVVLISTLASQKCTIFGEYRITFTNGFSRALSICVHITLRNTMFKDKADTQMVIRNLIITI